VGACGQPYSQMAEATRRARATGQSVSVDVDGDAQPVGSAAPGSLRTGGSAFGSQTLSRKGEHRHRMASGARYGSADTITGDGARPTRQPVDEVCSSRPRQHRSPALSLRPSA